MFNVFGVGRAGPVRAHQRRGGQGLPPPEVRPDEAVRVTHSHAPRRPAVGPGPPSRHGGRLGCGRTPAGAGAARPGGRRLLGVLLVGRPASPAVLPWWLGTPAGSLRHTAATLVAGRPDHRPGRRLPAAGAGPADEPAAGCSSGGSAREHAGPLAPRLRRHPAGRRARARVADPGRLRRCSTASAARRGRRADRASTRTWSQRVRRRRHPGAASGCSQHPGVRNALPYELWNFLHLSSYLVLLLGFGHQFANGAAALPARPRCAPAGSRSTSLVLAALLWGRVIAPLRAQPAAPAAGRRRGRRGPGHHLDLPRPASGCDRLDVLGRPVLPLAVPRPRAAGGSRTRSRSRPPPTAAGCG